MGPGVAAEPQAKGRSLIPLALATTVMLAALAAHFYYGFSALVDLGVLGGASVPPLFSGVRLTEAGRQLFAAGFDLALGTTALLIVIGFLRRRRWAWVAAMTWCAFSLGLGLVRYFHTDPRYPRMLAGVVLALALNQSSVHEALGVGVRGTPASGEPPESRPAGHSSGFSVITPGPELTTTAPAGASDLDLLRTFEPIVCFTHGEQFFPTDVERYVARSSRWARYPDGWEEMLTPEGELDIDKLVVPRDLPFGTVEFLRFTKPLGIGEGGRVLAEARRLRRQADTVFRPGVGRLARGGFLPRIADALFSASFFVRGKVPEVTAAAAELEYHRMLQEDEKYVYYGRVARQGGWTILQYWFFYCYNSWRSGYHGVNDHESDWENVLILLYEKDGRLIPEWAAYASHDFHGDDLRRRWDDREQLDLIAGHPLIWAGAGSHASYFRPGEYQAVVALPLPGWVRSFARALSRFWTRILGQAGKERDPLRIPFVDYARGDGKRIGPGQEVEWSPVVVEETTPWVGRYRGLWGLFARDPISGENAPAGPMYNRDGSPRAAWYDPLGFVGLDKEPPPPDALRLLEEDCAELEQHRATIDETIGLKVNKLHALSVRIAGMVGNPHLEKQHAALEGESEGLRKELRGLRRERSDNEATLGALRRRQERLSRGERDDPRAHIRNLATPVPLENMRLNRTIEAWGAVSISILMLGVVGLLIFSRGYLWTGLIIMVLTLIVVESVLRDQYARTIAGIAAVLAVISAVLLIGKFWLWVIAAALIALAFFLMVQKLREIRG